jgi:hypothetical protein
LLVLMGMLLMLGAVPAQAQVLDQSQPLHTAPAGITSGGSLAQTFTAGLTGDLSRVDVYLGYLTQTPPTQPITLEIRTADASGPTSTVLATETIPVFAVQGTGAFTTVQIDPPVAVTAGTQYAIVLYTADTAGYAWFWHAPTTYTGGDFWSSAASPPTTWTLFGEVADLTFETYVIPTYDVPTEIASLRISGSTIGFRLASPATVRFSLDRRVARNRYRRVGTFGSRARRGRNRVRIPRRLNGRRVGKGVFRLSARATNSGGRGALTRRVVRLR